MQGHSKKKQNRCLWTLAIFKTAMCGIRRKLGELNPTQGPAAEFEFLKTPCFAGISKQKKGLNPTCLSVCIYAAYCFSLAPVVAVPSQARPQTPLECTTPAECRAKIGDVVRTAHASPSEIQSALDLLHAIACDQGIAGKSAGDLAVRYTFELASPDEELQRRLLLKFIKDPAIHTELFRIAGELGVYVADDEFRTVMAAQLDASWPAGEEFARNGRCHPCWEFFLEDGDSRGLKWLEEMIKRDESHRVPGSYFRQFYDKMILHGNCPGLLQLVRDGPRPYNRSWALRQAWRYCEDKNEVANTARQCIEELESSGKEGTAIIILSECDRVGIQIQPVNGSIARIRLLVDEDTRGFKEYQRNHGETIETNAAMEARKRFYNSRP